MQSERAKEEQMTDGATAASMLNEVERVRGATRENLDPGWMPYLVFGLLTMVSAAFTQIGDGGSEGLYWLVAGPVGLAITWLFYRAQELRVGVVDRREHLLAGIVAAMVLGAIAVGWLTGEPFSEAGWMFSIGAGLLAIGVLEASAPDVGVGIAMLVAAVAITATDPGEPAMWAALLGGAILLGGAAATRLR
jgi:hypothetical protein